MLFTDDTCKFELEIESSAVLCGTGTRHAERPKHLILVSNTEMEISPEHSDSFLRRFNDCLRRTHMCRETSWFACRLWEVAEVAITCKKKGGQTQSFQLLTVTYPRQIAPVLSGLGKLYWCQNSYHSSDLRTAESTSNGLPGCLCIPTATDRIST